MNNKSSEIVFLRPPIFETDPRFEPILESLGIGYIVEYCRKKDIPCTYIDANLQNLSVRDVNEIIERLQPKFVGITITTEQIRSSTQMIINTISKLSSKPLICVGGHFVSYAYNEVLKNFKEIDVVCVGEGEYIISELIKNTLEGRGYLGLEGIAFRERDEIIYIPNVTQKVLDLDTLPWPARDYTQAAIEKSQLFCMISSRGCYGVCKFCAINNFTRRFDYKKWRGRDMKDVVRELKNAVKELGAKYILFCDDNFISPGKSGKQRIEEFIKLMGEDPVECEFAFFCRANDVISHQEFIPQLRKMGLRHMFVGVESASQRALDYFNKGITPDISKQAIRICKENDICIEIGFILFEPFTTFDEIILNLQFLKDIKMNSILRMNTKLSIYYDSNYILDLEQEGLIIRQGYEVYYHYKNQGIEYVEKMVNETFKYLMPLLVLFYNKKDCITSTWYRKSRKEIEDILTLEQLINDNITDILIGKVILLKESTLTMSSDELENLTQTYIADILKEISEYIFLAEAYLGGANNAV